MTSLFTQMAKHRMNNDVYSDFLSKLPEAIRKHTDWEYSYQQNNAGCFLKPTFRNMPYRNSFAPEIVMIVSFDKAHTVLQMSGQPVKFVRVFMTLWFSFLLTMEVFFLLYAITSELDNIFPVFIPVVLCAFGYLLCKVATKTTFHSIVKAIQKELT